MPSVDKKLQSRESVKEKQVNSIQLLRLKLWVTALLEHLDELYL